MLFLPLFFSRGLDVEGYVAWQYSTPDTNDYFIESPPPLYSYPRTPQSLVWGVHYQVNAWGQIHDPPYDYSIHFDYHLDTPVHILPEPGEQVGDPVQLTIGDESDALHAQWNTLTTFDASVTVNGAVYNATFPQNYTETIVPAHIGDTFNVTFSLTAIGNVGYEVADPYLWVRVPEAQTSGPDLNVLSFSSDTHSPRARIFGREKSF